MFKPFDCVTLNLLGGFECNTNKKKFFDVVLYENIMDTCRLLFVFIKVYTQNNTIESLVLHVTIVGNLEFRIFFWGEKNL